MKNPTLCDTAEKILLAGDTILREEGFSALSMRAIGTRVGISQVAIYRHYRDKDELIEALVVKGYAGMLEIVREAARSQASERGRLEATLRAYIGHMLERRYLFETFLLTRIGKAEAHTGVLSPGVASRRESMNLLTECIAKGTENGEFSASAGPTRNEAELTAQSVWVSVFGLISRIVIENIKDKERIEALVDRQISLVLGGLRRME